MQPILDAAIIGSGFSGLCIAIHLRKAGITNIQILEKAQEVGGTWRENTYPGAACDVQSHLYSFSFVPNPDWSHVYSGWKEIQRYIVDTSYEFGLRPHIRFGAEVVGAKYDETNHIWDVRLACGDVIKARTLIMGTGPLHVPAIPKIKGLDQFEGAVFHSAEWNHEYDLSGKRVASIGTGGSAVQYVPEVAEKAEKLSVFQRSAAWVLPRNERAYTKLEKWLFKVVPGWRRLYRSVLYWLNESRILPFQHPMFVQAFQLFATLNLKRSIKDKELRKKLTPDYTIGCKRILISNRYYPAFNRDNVDLVTDNIKEIRKNSIVTINAQGVEVEYEVDALILGTGFVTDPTEYMHAMPVEGLGGQNLLDRWNDSAEAYYGMNVSGFPNLFLINGPNTGLGHNSVVFMVEAQTNYIVDALKKLKRQGNGNIIGAMDVKEDVQQQFNEKLQKQLEGTVWQAGCNSWYIKDNGQNFTIWPRSTAHYYLQTKTVKNESFNWLKPCENENAGDKNEKTVALNNF